MVLALDEAVLVMVVAVLLVMVVAHVRASRAAGPAPVRARPLLERRLRQLPDRPPAGLPPLPDSPSGVAQECARGLRELEQWLADQACA